MTFYNKFFIVKRNTLWNFLIVITLSVSYNEELFFFQCIIPLRMIYGFHVMLTCYKMEIQSDRESTRSSLKAYMTISQRSSTLPANASFANK